MMIDRMTINKDEMMNHSVSDSNCRVQRHHASGSSALVGRGSSSSSTTLSSISCTRIGTAFSQRLPTGGTRGKTSGRTDRTDAVASIVVKSVRVGATSRNAANIFARTRRPVPLLTRIALISLTNA